MSDVEWLTWLGATTICRQNAEQLSLWRCWFFFQEATATVAVSLTMAGAVAFAPATGHSGKGCWNRAMDYGCSPMDHISYVMLCGMTAPRHLARKPPTPPPLDDEEAWFLSILSSRCSRFFLLPRLLEKYVSG